MHMSSSFCKRPIAAYFLLACAITTFLVSPLWLSSLGLITLSVTPVWHAFGALGPVIAAFAITAQCGGRDGVAGLWKRMTRWRVGAVWLMIVVLSPVALFGVAYAGACATGVPMPGLGEFVAAHAGDALWVANVIVPALAYGFGEEPGWRGFVLPRLQVRHSALTSTFILTALWGTWHLPFFLYRLEFGLGQVVGFFVSLLAGAVLFTCIYNATGGSVLMTSIWHTLWNVFSIAALDLLLEVVSIMGALVMVIAVVIVLVWKPPRLAPQRIDPLTGQEVKELRDSRV
jgi:membrane protease YdiL (CAAX protease family)